ncbi:WD domain G-beta repeat protein [Paragonimus westermani]|uniref:WD domain G-beta repeat protein n=1 Tax=Paragonimus westermani TaxID=34504 RepID=A0A8T0D5H9_9TREM|nr:WD domain G-beta repeat protein [Paragonimus westermani]
MDTENCFLTGAQDNTVQLWSLTNSYNSNFFPSQTSVQNFGQSTFASPHSKLTTNPTLRSTLSNPVIPSASIAARLVYREHKKSVFASIFLNNYRLIASCDGHLILWDPCTGQKVRGGFGTEAVLTAVTRSACPHGALLCADQRGQLFLIDPRAATRHRVQSLPLSSGISFASIVRGGLRMGTKSTSGASKNHDNKIDDPLTRQLYALYSSVRPQSSRSGTSVPNGARTNSAEGTLRHLAACDTSHVLLCGFTSGLMTALDLRQYQVVKAWQGHANTVAQVNNLIATHVTIQF